ncbi:MAG TPA: cyclic nucleotide-binding domain-containing protein [Bryobacteraceae bacterium]|nr:cyclic nucleotide-binding domain-containing protein [Bryobacteraceae bacterium]
MTAADPVRLVIDDLHVKVEPGTTIFDAARINGISIPVLCHQHNERPTGVCRVCCVDTGERAFTPACVRVAENGMTVKTSSDRVKKARRTLIELLMTDHPSPCLRERQSHDCELEKLARDEEIAEIRYPKRFSLRGRDDSSFVIHVDHDACILCDRCIRGCNEVRDNHVLGRMGKGSSSGIAFDLNRPMGNSTCISCGECMVSCPTGALTNKTVVGAVLPGEPVETEFLFTLPYFHEVSGTFLNLNRNAVVRREFKAGEIICREGEYGSTAFYILKGSVEVHIRTPLAHVSVKSSAGFFGKLTSFLAKKPDGSAAEQETHSIPIDAPLDLSLDKPTAMLGAGDIFGEMTCISLYPRSATVRAIEDCVMIEMLRNVLDMMLRNRSLRSELDARYRERALEDHLRGVPLFAPLSSEFIASLRDRVELLRFNKNEVICRQGETADRFYLIRIGFVKVTESHPGGDLVLAYLSKGGYFGEIGLLGGGTRTATVTALDHVELVSIQAEDFRTMLSLFPSVRESLELVAEDRISQNRHHVAASRSIPLDQFLSQGLMEANSLLLLDLEKCTRCDACVRACADAHDGVTRLIREGLRYENYLVATSCRQCRDPLCMVGCPVGSIRRRSTLEVVIEDWCIGCGLCAENCPYGNINMHPFTVLEANIAEAGSAMRPVVRQKATSCDLCAGLAEPSCVYACPHDAAHRVDPNEFFRLSDPL